MNNWLLVSIIGYLLLSIESVVTKILLTNRVKNWQLYSFYVGLLSLSGMLFAPFGLRWFGYLYFLESLIAGLIFFLALIFLYKALNKSSASRVFVLYGTVTTLFSFLWEHVLLKVSFSGKDLLGVFLLIVGGGLISYKIHERRMFSTYKLVIFSGFLMALALVLMKDVFDYQNFITGYVFSRLGIFLSAIFVMIFPNFRRAVKIGLASKNKNDNRKNFGFVLGAKIIAGLGTLLITYSISLGSVAIVNALVSVQYSFVFVIIVILTIFCPWMIKEKITAKNIYFKLTGLAFVVLGVCFIN